MFFNPRAVAVIGASESPGKLGNQVLANLISSGFPGQVYPINPRAEKILGLPCFKSVLDVPGPIDCAVVIVPAKFVSGVLEESGKKGIKGAIVITAGFKEAGPEGAALEQDLLCIAEQYDMRVIGPNCRASSPCPSR